MKKYKKRKRKTRRKTFRPGALIVLLLALLTAAYNYLVPSEPETAPLAEGEMQVHFIDVGQADCILIAAGGEYMLVDAGNNDDAATVTAYLKNVGVTRLKYVIGTHPHEDHIGSLDTVINNFEIDTLIMPSVTTTTQTFEDVLAAAESKGLSITLPVVGTKYDLGGAEFTIIAPVGEYGDSINNWSVGIRLVNGSTAFVMCGDAEATSEADIVSNTRNLSADVLKLGHHGSSTSTSDAFLSAVNPTCAVISCGADNSYGHPHSETLEKLARAGVSIYRTDTQGTLIATSDGESITWNVSPAA